MICYNCMEQIHSDRCPYCGFHSSSYVPFPTTLPPETVLRKTYLLGRVLGKGGFGVTYIGLDMAHGRKVAIKEFFPSTAATRDTARTSAVQPMPEMRAIYDRGVRKFYDEASVLLQLAGIPAIAQVYDFFYENETAYIVMEYIQGATIDQIVKNQGPLELDLVLTIYYPILRALDAIHQRGILHRDVSPCNIILDNRCNARLIDFGASRAYSSEMSTDMSVFLKNGFAPIEQYTRTGRHGPWEDIYALSASMYYTLTGKVPPAATDRMVFDTLKPISSFGVEIPDRLEQIILHGMAVRSSDRYHSAAQMCADIDAAILPNGDAQSDHSRGTLEDDEGEEGTSSGGNTVLALVLALVGIGVVALLVGLCLFFL